MTCTHDYRIVMGFRQIGNTLVYEYVAKCQNFRCGHIAELKPEMVEAISKKRAEAKGEDRQV